MSKLLDVYDDLRLGQEVIDEMAWGTPPSQFSQDDMQKLSRLSKRLDLFQTLLLEIINVEDVEAEVVGV